MNHVSYFASLGSRKGSLLDPSEKISANFFCKGSVPVLVMSCELIETSQSDQMLYQRNYVSILIKHLHILAVTQYSSTVRPEFNLREYATKREVTFAIEQLSLIGGSTMTSPALDYIRRSGFSADNGGRPNAPKVIILINMAFSQN